MRCLILFWVVFMAVASVAIAAEQKREPPMTVVIVRDSATDCEPLCPQWISAEGEITSASPALFRKAIAQSGTSKFPVLIQSGGGDVRAAVEIGRMIRKRGLDVGVGWTSFRGSCKPDQKCRLPAENRNVYRGIAYHTEAYCSSACPLILAAGVNRTAGFGTYIGVHQVLTKWVQGDALTIREKYYIVHGRKKVVSRTIVARKKGRSYTTNGLYKGLRNDLTAYLNTMGISLDLFDDMDKAPPTSIYWLSGEELSSLKLVTSNEQSDSMVSRSVCRTAPRPSLCVGQN